MHTITPEEFLATVFPRDLLLPGEAPVVAYPDWFISQDTGKPVDYYRQFHPRKRIPVDKATYFCVSTVQRQRRRQVKKRLQDVRTAMVLVVDDIGTKCQPPPVWPSYVLETSEGNYQWGYLIEPYDVSTPDGKLYYDSVLYSLALAGMNDPGFRSASRLARLPGSVHRTGFEARITHPYWAPDKIWELEDLVARFKIDIKQPARAAVGELAPGKYTRLADVKDPVYEWLIRRNMVYGHSGQWIYIRCPWRQLHTAKLCGGTSTAYSPPELGTAAPAFKCLHGHCAGRTTADFAAWLRSRGCDVDWGDPETDLGAKLADALGVKR